MDLGAYAQIEDLGEIMKENGISVPRLRGIRLMALEEPMTKEAEMIQAEHIGLYECECSCESEFMYDPICWTMSENTAKIKRKYLMYNPEAKFEPMAIRWNNIHGKKRKLFKYNMKMARRRVHENFSVFNKYCGRNDVLYIHARIGGENWPHYRKEVEHEPWFIEKVDDPFDSTYCDIYVRIKPVEVEKERMKNAEEDRQKDS